MYVCLTDGCIAWLPVWEDHARSIQLAVADQCYCCVRLHRLYTVAVPLDIVNSPLCTLPRLRYTTGYFVEVVCIPLLRQMCEW
ncbi:hypothetical protein M404DRAFT_998540 [Pisolithus tinctorius Marx 270]|uniref:Uncharacterized protein n=1 Tax=Pisolithus tinctorius Marx 270 TaxID=870435 RepID=A0A0C3P253_PISTI|nr:hypothetical protein M404DRAFT_998540 [Pisolithus tinctorius Marx 270]